MAKPGVAVFALVALSGLAFWLGPFLGTVRNDLAATDPISVDDPKYLDLGNPWESQSFSWKLPLHNRSARALEISDFAAVCSSCTPLSITPRSFVLQAGELRQLDLVFNLARRKEEDTEPWEQEFQATLAAQIKEPRLPAITWRFKGMVRKAIRGLPPLVDLGNIESDTSPCSQSFTVECHPQVKALSAHCDSASLTVNATPLGQRKYSIEVKVLTDKLRQLKAGSFRAQLSLTPKLLSGEDLPPRTLDVLGNAVPDVIASQEELALGAIRMSQQCTQFLSFRSRSGTPFHVKVEKSSDAIIINENGPNSATDRVYAIAVRAKKRGSQKEHLRFTLKSQGAETPITYEIKVTYHGIP